MNQSQKRSDHAPYPAVEVAQDQSIDQDPDLVPDLVDAATAQEIVATNIDPVDATDHAHIHVADPHVNPDLLVPADDVVIAVTAAADAPDPTHAADHPHHTTDA